MVVNKNKKNVLFFVFITCIMIGFSFTACDTRIEKPYGMNDHTGPGLVIANSHQAIPGGAIIKYTIPKDKDLMYIKVKYSLDSGKEIEKITSIYSDTLIIEGFGNSETKNISLIAVDRYENEGKTSTAKIKPGKPAYIKAYESITTKPAWGGLSVSIKNEDNATITVDILTTDSIERWYTAQTSTSSENNIRLAVREFDSIPRQFRIKVSDQWGNSSETMETKLTPLYEKQADRSKFRKISLPTDLNVEEYGMRMEMLWNGEVSWESYNMCHSTDFEHFPQWFTFDMGAKMKLSRYKYWQRQESGAIYQHGSIKTWEIWGCEDSPKPDGSWDGWIKLLDCESTKPSGRPFGMITAEDIEYAKRGEDFEFRDDSPPVRYIRFKALSTFSGSRFIHIQQLHFWGSQIE